MLDLGGKMILEESDMERITESVIETTVALLPADYVCISALDAIFETAKARIRTTPITFFQQYLEEKRK